MTYCIGWKDNLNVYLAADSAISFNPINKSELSKGAKYSSFGEIHEEYSRKHVEEGKLKLNNLANQIIVASAGSVQEINDVLESIEESLNLQIPIRKALEIVSNSVAYNNAQLLIGFMENQRPVLLYFDTKTINEAGDIFQIGSGIGRDTWTDRMKWLIEKSINMRYSQEMLLTSVVSVLQSYAMRERMMPLGVGGVFTGVSVSTKGVKWCDDITYYVYNEDLSNYDIVTVVARDDSLFVASSFNSAFSIFPARKHLSNFKQFWDNWDTKAHELLINSRTDHFVFTSIFYAPIILIQINGKLHNNYFRMWKKEEGSDTKYRFAFTELIYNALKGKGIDEDEILFFNWLFSEEVEYKNRKELIIERGHQDLVDDLDEEFI